MFWFTSDTHFNHNNIIEYTNRPFKSSEHMDREIIRRWNTRVKENDIVYHLGDFGFLESKKDYYRYEEQLNGTIVLIKGNHDGNNNIPSILTCGSIHYGGFDWWMEHVPTYQYKHNLCGHVHGLWKVQFRGQSVMVNVGLDQWNYYPITIAEIIKEIGRIKAVDDSKPLNTT